MLFVKFKIDNGGIEYFDYSWFNNYSIAHYEDAKSITDKDMILETYVVGQIELEDYVEENFNEDTNTYEDYNNDWISVHKVQEMTEKELDVLSKLEVLYR